MKHFKKEMLQKALFLLPISLLVAALVVSQAAAAPTVKNYSGSSARSLIHANGPHTYIDWKQPWTGSTAATLAKYDIAAFYYTESAAHIREVKAINPNTVVLAYFDPLFGGDEGNSHSEWYLRDAAGANHPSGYANERLMDLTQPGWRAMCVQTAQGALQKGFDGLVLDNGLSSPNVCFPRSWSGSDSAWQASTIALFTSIKQAAGNKIVLYNGAYFIPGYVDAVDGWMDEGFPFFKGWDNSIGFALDASSKGKLTLMYAQGSPADRYFTYCSALLTDGYIHYAPTGIQWFNDYGINLGPALNTAHKQSDGTWQRDYQYGTVMVNPGSKTAHIDMKQNQANTVPQVTSTSKSVTPVKTTKATPSTAVKPQSQVKTTKATPSTAVKAAATLTNKTPAVYKPVDTATVTKAAASTPTPKTGTAITPVQTPQKQAASPIVASEAKGLSQSTSQNTASIAPVTTDATNTTPNIAVSTGQTNAQMSGVASLPPQPVLEFSVVGLGLPAIVVGLIYLFIRR
ncbi:MAG: putative glycoside hydrolase [Halobacteriota archaeon]